MSDDNEAPGWDAIDDAFRGLYGDQTPLHWGTVIPWSMGGPDPLPGISAYAVDGDVPHWHVVTYGFSDLWDKQTNDAEVSGFGFELTLRLRRGVGEERPPGWALSLLQNLGRYVFGTGNRFAPGHTMPLNGPIALGRNTRLHFLAFRAV